MAHRARVFLIAAVSLSGCRSAGVEPAPQTTASPGVKPAPLPSGAWQTLTTEGEPEARHECALAAHGGRLYLLGGRKKDTPKPTDIFDPARGRWSRGAAPPIELHHFHAVTLGDRIYAIGALGGRYPAEEPVGDVWTYAPARDAWEKGAPLPAGRARGAAGLVAHEGRLYLLGGLTEGHNGGFQPWFDVFDPRDGRWQTLPDAPHARDHFSAVVVTDETGAHLVAAGGRTTSAKTGDVLNLTIGEVDVFDFASGTWRTLPANAQLPTQRAGTSAVVIDGHVVVMGGESANQKEAHAEVQALALASLRWINLPPLARGRHGTGAAVIDDQIFIAAGSGNRGGGPELASLEVWRR